MEASTDSGVALSSSPASEVVVPSPAVKADEEVPNTPLPEEPTASPPKPIEKVRQLDNESFYVGPVTTEEMIKVYDEKNKSLERLSEIDTSSIDNVLANLQCGEVEPIPVAPLAQNVANTTEDLLAILEGDTDTTVKNDDFSKPAKKRNIRNIVLDPVLEKSLALKQLRELPAVKRNKPVLLNAIADVTIPSVKTSPNFKTYIIEKVAANENDKPKTAEKADDISFIHDDWSDDESSEKHELGASQKATSAQNGSNKKTDDDDKHDEGLTKGRVSRLIKKKIIWDPDNTDSVKIANVIKKKPEKLEEKPKKPEQNGESADDQSPGKQLANSNKKKKMSEVDKLLMDEGVVNMMYQLEVSNNSDIPDINVKPNKHSMINLSKERRSLENKAKIIRNMTLNTANASRDKVFRPRQEHPLPKSLKKRESKTSTTSDAHSTLDESRIIRRHSSSSFSSGCLSPRPQSPSENSTKEKSNHIKMEKPEHVKGVKRKSPMTKPNPIKIKKTDDKIDGEITFDAANYPQLSVERIENNILHICIKAHNSKGLFDAKMLRELYEAVSAANQSNTRVLIVTSEDGMLCGGLDLNSIVQSRHNLQKTNAAQLLEAMRDLVLELAQFRGALVFGIDGPCSGFGVALLSLADLVLASDRATFCVAPANRRRLPPEAISLLSINNFMPPQLSRELVYCGRKLNASEALHRGIISRTLWTDGYSDEIVTIAKDLSQQPEEVFKIAKSTLNGEHLQDIERALEDETVRLAEFWCSTDGQESIRAVHSDV